MTMKWNDPILTPPPEYVEIQALFNVDDRGESFEAVRSVVFMGGYYYSPKLDHCIDTATYPVMGWKPIVTFDN